MTKLNADYNKIFNYFLLGYILLISVAAYSTKNNILLILNSFAGMSFWFLLCFGVLTVLKKRHKDNKRHLSEKPNFFLIINVNLALFFLLYYSAKQLGIYLAFLIALLGSSISTIFSIIMTDSE
ncbi:hypothetical protein COZ22_01715 [bacterium (Candidatus Howlettbacteria) CG_4_10_14_3_um_filter_37_10]|nr:MAG: hypothetical protein COX25_05335 [bacterium (Candidatus Howlettbacteria) CG23_combo_of_CG06-09_8_20_14_all_37_9]PIX99765.1 MAG: hypothetical protein COZ22_01715 [bacterium (Candidatus Howlettbacteria) CG_4_10_14_3_um_filter_37_10]PJB06738.1 MAG: hypothetical protein CO123_01445 [bacterium (Candidatus Howlettbacteria) CG_4_9_14_3_um_filter_37_10]